MSLLNTASVWNNQNNNSNSRKRTPQLKRVSNNTAKVRPYDRENFTTNDFSELSEFPSIEETAQSNEENSFRIKNIIEKISLENDGDKLSDFQPLEPPNITSNSSNDSEMDLASDLKFDPNDLLPKTLEKQKSNFSNNDIPTLNLSDYNHTYSYNTPVYVSSQPKNTDNRLLEKINYMIHLLEEQKVEKTANITEEFILYTFLGVFVIYIVDTFSRNGKYTR